MFIVKMIGGLIINLAIFGILLFTPPGTLHWWRAWAFLGVILVASVVTFVTVFPGNEELLNERFKPPIQKGQPLADKVVVIPLILSMFGDWRFIPYDVFRFHLMAKPWVVVSSIGLVLIVAGWWIISLVFRENAFAAPVVKHQAERHQKVIDTGVYSVIRHAMYAGAILFLVGIALWLESYAAALLLIVPFALLAVRILIEEQFLKRELSGYDAYTQRVRYRLIPFLW